MLWAANGSLKGKARNIISDRRSALVYSVASIWEVAIKNSLGRDDFSYDPLVLVNGLSSAGYEEMPVAVKHILALAGMTPLHKDPFDRILVAQAIAEGCCLLTSDKTLSGYGDFVISV